MNRLLACNRDCFLVDLFSVAQGRLEERCRTVWPWLAILPCMFSKAACGSRRYRIVAPEIGHIRLVLFRPRVMVKTGGKELFWKEVLLFSLMGVGDSGRPRWRSSRKTPRTWLSRGLRNKPLCSSLFHHEHRLAPHRIVRMGGAAEAFP